MSKHLDSETARSEPPPGPCELARGWLEAYLDGELAAAERELLDSHLAACPACAAELALAERIRVGLGALRQPPCPPKVTAAVLAHTVERPGTLGSLGRRLSAPQLWQGVLAAAAALLVIVWLGGEGDPATVAEAPALQATPAPQVSPADVRQAEQDVKLALAYLGRISEKTGQTVSREVLGHRALEPVARTLGPLLSPAEPEDKGHAG